MVTSKSFDNTNPTGDGASSSPLIRETVGMFKNSTPFFSETRLDDSTSLKSCREGSLRPYLLSTLARSLSVGRRRSIHDTLRGEGDTCACSEQGYSVSIVDLLNEDGCLGREHYVPGKADAQPQRICSESSCHSNNLGVHSSE